MPDFTEIKWIDALDDLAVGYASGKWDMPIEDARAFIKKAIEEERLRQHIPQDEFMEYVEVILKLRTQGIDGRSEILRQYAKEPMPFVPPKKDNGNTTYFSIVLGLLSWVAWIYPICGFPVSGIGFSLGTMALKSSKRTLAIVGIVISSIGILATTINSAAGAYLGFTGQYITFSSPTPIISPTRTPRPTPTRIPQTPTPEMDCRHWSSITASSRDRRLCVYGTVNYTREYFGASQIRFGDDTQFFFSSGTVYYPDAVKGSCVYAIGTILLSSERVPYIDVDENPVYECESWMK